jgi:hypothetical protein
MPSASTTRAYDLPAYLRGKHADARKPSTNPPHVVTTCEDDFSSGSLRRIIESSTTVSGDTIDLTQLPMACSKITLAQNVPLEIWQDRFICRVLARRISRSTAISNRA